MKKFWDKVEAAFKKLFGSTKWEQTATSVITYVAPLVETIVGLAAGGPAEALVTSVVNIVKSDLATVSAIVSGATETPAGTALVAVKNALSSIQTNLGSVLSDADVKNSAKYADITSVVNLIVGEVEAVLSNIPA